jgi:hypothetical protein
LKSDPLLWAAPPWEPVSRPEIYNELAGKTAAIDGRLRTIIERSGQRQAKVVSLAREAAS